MNNINKRFLNTNEHFLEEAQQLAKHWEKSGLLDELDKSDRATTAVLLECQRLHNETGTWDCCDECREREKKELATKAIPKKGNSDGKRNKPKQFWGAKQFWARWIGYGGK